MIALLIAHALAALAAPALIRAAGPRVLYGLALVPAAACAWAVAHTGRTPAETLPWVPQLGTSLSLRLTPLAWLLVVLVGGIGAVVLAYGVQYFDAGDRGLGRFAAVFLAFAGAMIGLVVADDLIVLYVFWELTTVFSYLLIAADPAHRPGRRAAQQALLVTTLGGLAMLVGFVMLGQRAGTYRWSEIAADPPAGGAYLSVAIVLILLGALSKSAIVPFSFWLPAAMTAPTPVSAYLHAASMVKAGVFLVGLLAPVFAGEPPWRPVVAGAGLLTLFLGASAALRQHDLKLLLAYGTVSQLGMLTVVLGAGTREAALAGSALLLAHALFKAALFLVVGIVDRCAGTRDLRELSGLGRRLPVVAGVAVLAAASMAGVPPLAGFTAKEAVFTAFRSDPVVLAALVAGAALTVAYSLRFLWGAFATKPGAVVVEPKRPGWAFTAPAAVLAFASLVAGAAAGGVDGLLRPYAQGFGGGTYRLALWHGLSPALALSGLAVAAGAGIFALQRAGRRPVGPARTAGAAAYRHTMSGVDRLAAALTGATQRGSLPFSIGVILVVLVVFAAAALAGGAPWPGGIRWWDSPVQAVAAAVVLVAAVAAARARRRLTAMVLAGVSGYGIAVLFVLHGAPDLALTQFLVETVTIVMLVLVLRRLPATFSARPRRLTRRVRVGLAVAVGAVTAGMAYVAAAGRQAIPISVDFPELAVSYGGGHNIVNVALVDIRAWDTMGEISVLVVAATGVASLIFRRTTALEERTAAGGRPAAAAGWLMAGDGRESIILQVVARLMFHTVVLFSVYLLFSGHDAIGGGFAGGLVAGLALTVRFLAGGLRELDAAAPVDAGLLLGTGLLVAVGTGTAGLLLGGEVLQSALLDLHLPLLGHVHLATSMFFDIGVYLIVVALVMEILRSLGREPA